MTRSKSVVTVVVLLLMGGACVGCTPRDDLQVQVLDVSGYTDNIPTWMVFRVTLGLSNVGRDPVRITRVAVAPDLDGYNEAYNVGTYELQPPLLIEPGNRASYQATTTLLNATQLPERTYRLMLRVRIERDDRETVVDFPARYEHSREPARRVLQFYR